MVKQGVWHLSTESQFRWSFRLNLCDILFTEFWFPTFWKESKSSLIYWRCCKRGEFIWFFPDSITRGSWRSSRGRRWNGIDDHTTHTVQVQGQTLSWFPERFSSSDQVSPLSWGQITEAFLKVKRCRENKNRGGTEVCSLQCDKDSKASWPTSDSFFFFF